MKEMIHKSEQNGQYIVLDVCSGGVHIVDELTYKPVSYTHLTLPTNREV